MARDLSTTFSVILGEKRLPAVFMFEGEFPSGTVRFWSGTNTLSYGGNDYLGGGGITGFSQYDETQDMSINGMSFQLAAPSSVRAIALEENYRRAPCRLNFAFRKRDLALMLESNVPLLFESGVPVLLEKGDLFGLVDTPYTWFEGQMNVMKLDPGENGTVITLQADNELIILKQVKVLRFTPESQKARFAGDTFLDRIATMQDKVLPWGSAPQTK